MNPQQIRMQAIYLFLAIGCAFLLSVGCDGPPRERAIETVDGQVETDYAIENDTLESETPNTSGPMLDNGTALRETQKPGEETWASPDEEPDSDVKVEDEPDAPAKPQFDLNAGTGSSEDASEEKVMELRDESLRAGE